MVSELSSPDNEPQKVVTLAGNSRARRKKCDEARPQCHNCQERGESCRYTRKRASKAVVPIAVSQIMIQRL